MAKRPVANKRPAPRATAKPARPESAYQRFFKSRFLEVLGFGLMAVAVAVAASLVTHHSGDPSFNRSGYDSLENVLGIMGAYSSDVLLQTVGIAAALMVVCLLSWGWRLMSKQHVRGWWIRVSAMLGALISVSALMAYLPAWPTWSIATGLGGSIGMVVQSKLGGLITDYGVIAVMVLMSAALLPLAIGLRRKEWVMLAVMFSMIAQGFWRVMRLIGQALRGSSSRDEEEDELDEEDEKPSRLGRGRAQLRSPDAAPKLHVKKIAARKLVDDDDDEVADFIPAAKATQSSFDLRGSYEGFELPDVELLSKASAKNKKKKVSESSLSQNAELLEKTLGDFGVKGEITRVRPGPVVTLYELEPSAGTKSSRVIGLADDIARSMSAISARIAVVPGKNALGIEMPNVDRETVYLREMFEHETYKNTQARLPLVLGKDISGDPVIADLARMPHLLVAGTTGSGKSVAINTMIMSLVYHLTPEQCKFIMIDPKMLELSVYDGIPHLLSPVVTEPGKAVVALKWTVKEMENRYRLMSNLGVRNIDNYNKRVKDAEKKGEELFRTVQTGFDPNTGKPIMEKVAIDMNPLPFIVVVVDEMADLMLVAGKDIETSVQRLAQMARAAGIHIIMATQRPSVDVITGVIKANFPTRISFQVTSKIDSRTILGEQGAEQLLGAGDMLYMAGGGRIQRVHGPFIADKEVETIVSFLKTQGEPIYVEDVTKEEEELEFGGAGDGEDGDDRVLFDQAVQIVLRDQKASTSYIQRKLKIGYNRAARLIDQMEEEGIVGQANHVGKREVLHRHAS